MWLGRMRKQVAKYQMPVKVVQVWCLGPLDPGRVPLLFSRQAVPFLSSRLGASSFFPIRYRARGLQTLDPNRMEERQGAEAHGFLLTQSRALVRPAAAASQEEMEQMRE